MDRRSLRLPGYDYSQNGVYFVTMVTQGRKPLFGDVVDGEMVLNEVGRMVEKVWLEIPGHFTGVDVDTFIIMPNHVHAIIEIKREDRSPVVVGARHAVPLPEGVFEAFGKPLPGSIPTIIRSFKSEVTKRYHVMTKAHETRLWQRNYYEHVIRNEHDHLATYDYILANPLNWEKDEER